jgi:hypothetical protein
LVLWITAGALGRGCSAAFAERTTGAAGIDSSAALVDCTTRVGVVDESDVAHHAEIVATVTSTTSAAASTRVTGQADR